MSQGSLIRCHAPNINFADTYTRVNTVTGSMRRSQRGAYQVLPAFLPEGRLRVADFHAGIEEEINAGEQAEIDLSNRGSDVVSAGDALDVDFADAVANADIGFSWDVDAVAKFDVGLALEKTEESALRKTGANLETVVEAAGFDAHTLEIAARFPLVIRVIAPIGLTMDHDLHIVAIPSLNINLAEGFVDVEGAIFYERNCFGGLLSNSLAAVIFRNEGQWEERKQY